MNKPKYFLIINVIFALFVCTTGALGCGAPQTVAGRIVTDSPDEMLVVMTRGVRVLLTDPSGAQETRVVTANPFGYFRFNDVAPCLPYTVVAGVSRKFPGFEFAPPARSIYVRGDEAPEFLIFELYRTAGAKGQGIYEKFTF